MWLSGCVCDVVGSGVSWPWGRPMSNRFLQFGNLHYRQHKKKCPSVSLGAAEQFVHGPCSSLVGIVGAFLWMWSVVGLAGCLCPNRFCRKRNPGSLCTWYSPICATPGRTQYDASHYWGPTKMHRTSGATVRHCLFGGVAK